MSVFFALFGREIRLVLCQPGEAVLAMLFFLLGGAIFPIALGPDPALLAIVAPGILWAMALFAALPVVRQVKLIACCFSMKISKFPRV